MKLGTTAARTQAPRSTRDLILDAAEARFAERGFAGVSVREIATDVGLKNQASLYHHFKNKRDLYEAVLARGVETLVQLFTSTGGWVATDTSFTDATLDPVIDYLIEHPQLPRLIQRAGIDDPRYLRPTVTRLLRPLYAQGMQLLASANAAWAAEELPHVAAGCFHLIFGYFANAKLLEMVVQRDPLSPAAVARQRRFLKRAVAQLLGVGSLPQESRDLAPRRTAATLAGTSKTKK
jgi:AcrR family transcriptional regulator